MADEEVGLVRDHPLEELAEVGVEMTARVHVHLGARVLAAAFCALRVNVTTSWSAMAKKTGQAIFATVFVGRYSAACNATRPGVSLRHVEPGGSIP